MPCYLNAWCFLPSVPTEKPFICAAVPLGKFPVFRFSVLSWQYKSLWAVWIFNNLRNIHATDWQLTTCHWENFSWLDFITLLPSPLLFKYLSLKMANNEGRVNDLKHRASGELRKPCSTDG